MYPMQRKFGALAIGILAVVAAGGVHAETVTMGGTGSALEAVRMVATAYAKKDKDFEFKILPSLGSSGAIKGLAERSLDIGMIARALKDTEKAQGLQATRLGQTPVVLATSKANEKNVSGAQLEEFYSGRTKRWADNSPVRLVLRPLTETDTQLISNLTPGMKAAVESASTREGLLTASTDQESADNLEKLPGSLGTASLSLLVSEKRRLAVLTLDGVAPQVAGKANPGYPLMKPLFVVVHDDAKPSVRKFVAFMQSAPGAAILEKAGYTYEFR